MATNYGITASTSADALRGLVNTAYSEVYSLAAMAGSTAATTISNLLTLPETVSNWPLYAYMMVPKVERLLFIDIEQTDQLEGTRGRILQLLALLCQIARYAAAAPADKSALFISRLVVVSSIAASRLSILTPLASLQVACQALASQLDSASWTSSQKPMAVQFGVAPIVKRNSRTAPDVVIPMKGYENFSVGGLRPEASTMRRISVPIGPSAVIETRHAMRCKVGAPTAAK